MAIYSQENCGTLLWPYTPQKIEDSCYGHTLSRELRNIVMAIPGELRNIVMAIPGELRNIVMAIHSQEN